MACRFQAAWLSVASSFKEPGYPSAYVLSALAVLAGVLVAFSMALGTKKKFKLPPGPPTIPFLGSWLQFRDGLNARNLADAGHKYGPVCLLRMGQRNVIVISSPDMAKEVLQTQGIEFGSRSRNLVFDMTTGQGSDMVFADYGEHWRKMRRIATLPFFTNKVVQQSRDSWLVEIQRAMVDIVSDPAGATTGIYIRDRLQLMVYNIVYQMMFAKRFSGMDDPLYVGLMKLNHENVLLGQSFKYNYGDFVPSFRPFLRRYLQSVWDANQRRLSYIRDNFLSERRKLGNKEKIGVDHFLEAENRGEINESNVLYLVQNMNVAAIETTLWSSEWAVAELVNHPEIQSKLIAELDSVLGRGVPVTEPDIVRLPYLQAMVREILRKHMVIPMLVPHANLQNAKLGGYDIPAGSRVLVNAWGIANDPNLWDKPEEFNPDRFMGEDKIDPNGNDFRFIPFGSGRRSCPGMILAQPLLALIIARMVQSFELLPSPGVTKVDLSEKGGQLSMILAKRSLVIVKPRTPTC